MSKKKKPEQQTSSSEPSSAAATATAAASGASPEVVRVEQAFAVGNYSFVRKAAADPTHQAASEAAKALLPRVVVEPVQVMVGLIGLVVVLTAWALTVTTG